MKASFFEFNVAATGLFVAKNALNVVSHNIANSKTEGYSRQVAQLRTSQPLTFYDGRGMVGTGAEVYGIGQIRSAHLDQKYWSHNSVLGEHHVKRQQLALTESVFNSLSETGLSGTLDSFFSSLSDLTTTANDTTYRANVLQVAETLAKQLNATYISLEQQQVDLNEEIRATVSIINGIGVQIKNLNEQIVKYEMDGSNANDLRDRRATLIDELSKYVNVDTKETSIDRGNGIMEKRFSVQIDGTDFVKHDSVSTLGVQSRTRPTNPDDSPGMYDIFWESTGREFRMYSSSLQGELKGLLELRDGNNGSFMQGSTSSVVREADGFKVTVTNPSKMDLLGTGKITMIDPNTGKNHVFEYEGLVKTNVDGDEAYTFTIPLDQMSAAEETLFTTENSVDVVSGQTSDYKGVPYYLERLNELVRNIARAMNEGTDAKGDRIPGVLPHSEGYDVNGENHGYLMFTYTNNAGIEQVDGTIDDYMEFTAKNFRVSSFLQDNPEFLAASSSATVGESNNEVILSFSKIRNYNALFREGSISDYSIAVSTSLGIDLKQSVNFEKNYTDVTTGIQNQRLSVMGVDIDEETTNMIKYNELLRASAKLITVIDGIYDTIINRLGV